jgi:hypothetical protein
LTRLKKFVIIINALGVTSGIAGARLLGKSREVAWPMLEIWASVFVVSVKSNSDNKGP